MEPFSAERYFATQLPPPHLSELISGVHEFVERNHQQGRRIVLVTASTAHSMHVLAAKHSLSLIQ
jgi:hypothetical protein